jgi:hypothetical protein
MRNRYRTNSIEQLAVFQGREIIIKGNDLKMALRLPLVGFSNY